jgi:hypothetical protein
LNEASIRFQTKEDGPIVDGPLVSSAARILTVAIYCGLCNDTLQENSKQNFLEEGNMRPVLCAIVAMSLLTGTAGSLHAQDSSTIVLTPMTVDGSFLGKKKGKTATDISGIACLPKKDERLTCLLINDENKNAQAAVIANSRLIVGQPIELIGDEPAPNTLGTPPDLKCKKIDDFDNLDGEGVAYSAPYFYVIGSHGCSRKKGEFRLSSFILARVRVDDQGRPADSNGSPLPSDRVRDAVETTYRVSDLLRHAEPVSKFFGKDLNSADGLNIEGLAAQGDTIWFGLRAPVDKDAFLVRGSAADLFRPGHAPSETMPKPIPIRLDGLGIRDLAVLPDNRLLVLAGASHGKEVPFKLFVVDAGSGAAKPIGSLTEIKQLVDGKMETGKAEAVTIIGSTTDRTRILVLFDGLVDGAPHQGEIRIPN